MLELSLSAGGHDPFDERWFGATSEDDLPEGTWIKWNRSCLARFHDAHLSFVLPSAALRLDDSFHRAPLVREIVSGLVVDSVRDVQWSGEEFRVFIEIQLDDQTLVISSVMRPH